MLITDPRFKVRQWTTQKLSWFGYSFIDAWRASWCHTEVFRATAKPFWRRNADAIVDVFLGTEGGVWTGSVGLAPQRTTSAAHIGGQGTEAERNIARAAGLTDSLQGFHLTVSQCVQFYDDYVQGMEEHFGIKTYHLDASI